MTSWPAVIEQVTWKRANSQGTEDTASQYTTGIAHPALQLRNVLACLVWIRHGEWLQITDQPACKAA